MHAYTFAFAPDGVDPAYAGRLNALTLQDDNLQAMACDRLAYDADIAWVDARVPSLQVPSVTLLATDDRPIPIRHGRRLAAALPQTERIEVPGGHMLPVVQPEAVANAIAHLSPDPTGAALAPLNPAVNADEMPIAPRRLRPSR